MKKFKYNLHSVCIHEGTSTSGHFWTYIWNPRQQKWYKYNDTEVSETTWDDLYANSVGGTTTNNQTLPSDKSDANQPPNINDLSSNRPKQNDRIPSAYFLIYTRQEDSTLYEGSLF